MLWLLSDPSEAYCFLGLVHNFHSFLGCCYLPLVSLSLSQHILPCVGNRLIEELYLVEVYIWIFGFFFLQHTLSSYLFPLDNHSLKVLLWFYNFLVIFIRIAQFQCPRISLAYWKSFHLKISSEFASNSHFKSAGERCGLALRYLLSISLLSTSCSNVWSREDGWRSRVNLI